jgi:hypothetical protein
MGRSRRLASSWMSGSSKSEIEIWMLERELRKAFNCSSTNAGLPDVGAIGRFGSWNPVGGFGVKFDVVGWSRVPWWPYAYKRGVKRITMRAGHRVLITLRTGGGDLLLGSGIDSLARSWDELGALASGAFKCAPPPQHRLYLVH